MNTGITVLHVVLILFAGAAGTLRLATPYARFTQLPLQGWSKEFQPWQVKLIGLMEVLAAAGMVAALVLGSMPILMTLAAVSVALVMAGAMATHFRRGEYPNMVGNLAWLGLALYVAYGSMAGAAV